MAVPLRDILLALRYGDASIVGESAGYLILGAADSARKVGGFATLDAIHLSGEGAVALEGAPCSPQDAEDSLRALLSVFLKQVRSPCPNLERVAERHGNRGLPGLVAELEAALIPVNRRAARRTLARLAREAVKSASIERTFAQVKPIEPRSSGLQPLAAEPGIQPLAAEPVTQVFAPVADYEESVPADEALTTVRTEIHVSHAESAFQEIVPRAPETFQENESRTISNLDVLSSVAGGFDHRDPLLSSAPETIVLGQRGPTTEFPISRGTAGMDSVLPAPQYLQPSCAETLQGKAEYSDPEYIDAEYIEEEPEGEDEFDAAPTQIFAGVTRLLDSNEVVAHAAMLPPPSDELPEQNSLAAMHATTAISSTAQPEAFVASPEPTPTPLSVQSSRRLARSVVPLASLRASRRLPEEESLIPEREEVRPRHRSSEIEELLDRMAVTSQSRDELYLGLKGLSLVEFSPAAPPVGTEWMGA